MENVSSQPNQCGFKWTIYCNLEGGAGQGYSASTESPLAYHWKCISPQHLAKPKHSTWLLKQRIGLGFSLEEETAETAILMNDLGQTTLVQYKHHISNWEVRLWKEAATSHIRSLNTTHVEHLLVLSKFIMRDLIRFYLNKVVRKLSSLNLF